MSKTFIFKVSNIRAIIHANNVDEIYAYFARLINSRTVYYQVTDNLVDALLDAFDEYIIDNNIEYNGIDEQFIKYCFCLDPSNADQILKLDEVTNVFYA